MRLTSTALLFLLIFLICNALAFKPQLLGRHTVQTYSHHRPLSYKTLYFDQQVSKCLIEFITCLTDCLFNLGHKKLNLIGLKSV